MKDGYETYCGERGVTKTHPAEPEFAASAPDAPSYRAGIAPKTVSSAARARAFWMSWFRTPVSVIVAAVNNNHAVRLG